MSRQEALRHPDIQAGLYRPQIERAPVTHKEHKGIKRAAYIGLAATIAAGGVYAYSFFGKDNGDGNMVVPPVVSNTLNPRETSIETSSTSTVTIYSTEPTKTESSKPIETTVTTTTESSISQQNEDLIIKEKLALAPEIEGAVKVIKEIDGLKRITYEVNGVYVGEYKKEVTFEGQEVGGVVLIPKMVEKMLAKNKEFIFIPADISEINDNSNVNLEFLNISFQDKEYTDVILKIDTNGKNVSISNPIIDNEITNQAFTNRNIFPDYLVNGICVLQKDTNKYDFTIYGNFAFTEKINKIVPFGQKLTETKTPIGLILNTKTGPESIDESKILKIGKSIVFMENVN